MKSLLYSLVIAGVVFLPCSDAAAPQIVTDPGATPRELYGAARLADAIAKAGVSLGAGSRILAGARSSSIFANTASLPAFPEGATEAFRLKRSGNDWLVAGRGGAVELQRRGQCGPRSGCRRRSGCGGLLGPASGLGLDDLGTGCRLWLPLRLIVRPFGAEDRSALAGRDRPQRLAA